MKRFTCKICRRLGISVCGREKCALRRKPYPPGVHGEKRQRRSASSEFGRQLLEKQKIRHAYHLSETQFGNYLKEVLRKTASRTSGGDKPVGDALAEQLELRLDNVVFRSGFAPSRSAARQLVSHGHFLVNNRKVDIPSFHTRVNDTISVRPESMRLGPFANLKSVFGRQPSVSWLRINTDTFTVQLAENPTSEESAFPGDVRMVVEYYSR